MIQLKNYPIFRQWCERYKNGFGRIDLLSLGDKEKDAGMAAYCLDVECPGYDYLASKVNSEYTPSSWKNDLYASIEVYLIDLCDQFNAKQDEKDAANSDQSYIYSENLSFDEESFSRIFRTDQAMIDSGHKQSDF